MSGGLVALALWLGKGQIAFVLFSLVLLYLGRKLGWWLSKASLYDDPLPVVLIECVIWGGLVAYLMHDLIIWHRPHWILRWVFGFGVGSYVSVPSFGLIRDDTIPEHARSRHEMVSMLPMWVFILASVGLAFLR